MTNLPKRHWPRTLLTLALAAATTAGMTMPQVWAADAPKVPAKGAGDAPAKAPADAPKPAAEAPKAPAAAPAEPPKTPAVAKPAAPASDEPAVDPVEAALKKAVAFLYASQKNGHWEATPVRNIAGGHADTQWGGISAMAVYGLLAAGERQTNPKIQQAMQFMDAADVVGTYAMGMKLQTWNYVPSLNAAQKKVLMKDATLLMGGANLTGPAQGLYHYMVKADNTYDISCSNYGVLGMWAAANQNLEIPDKYWELVDTAWRKQQNNDGGWQYGGGGKGAGAAAKSTLAMTAAGVATLFVTQDMLSAGKKAECKGNQFDKEIEAGLAWMAKNYTGGGGNLYAMYNVERVGTASGYKYFGTTDWYKEGSQALLKSQAANGSWGGVPPTVWAIMFLVKGRAPVMMNKLEYGIETNGDKDKPANWNERPRDVANLARWAGKQLEKELNWQIVNLKVDIEDLHDSPILYMSGNQVMNFSKDEKAKLKQFVEGGGLILGNADCSDTKFSGSFIKLGQELFPAYEFRSLPASHLVYNVHYNVTGTNKDHLKGLSNGAREMMLLLHGGDPAGFWQIRNFGSAQSKAMSELVSNIYLYALDKMTLQSKFKGQSYIVKRDEKAKTSKTTKVARLEYSGNWNPEPGGWRRIANLMHNTKGVELTVEPVQVGTGKLTKDFQVAHLTGTAKFKLTDAQRKEIKDWVDAGGTLIVDAAGGESEFKDSADAELAAMFPTAASALGSPLPVSHAIYSGGTGKLAKASYRSTATKVFGNLSTPRLRGIEVNNRTAVFYSPEDLSVGIVGMSFDGIYGYAPAYATELMQGIIGYALGGGAGPVKVAAGAAGAGEAQPAGSKEKPATPAATPAAGEKDKKAAPAPGK